jgi:hypothetical protein
MFITSRLYDFLCSLRRSWKPLIQNLKEPKKILSKEVAILD